MRTVGWAMLLASAAILALGQNPPAPKQAQKPASTQANPSEGERKFAEHCGRCHTTPADAPPKAAKTILHHMRVRAMLTEEDERLILQYIAP